MEAIYTCCAGLDVHKQTVECVVRRAQPNGGAQVQVRQFGTMTDDLLEMVEWLKAKGVTHVAMESTGVFWKPIFNLLEGHFEVLLVNARHVHQVPGRKTDVRDCQWLAQLLQYGLLRASFIPPRWQRDLRDLTRERTQLIDEQTRVANRIHKVLEDANIKLGSVATDILGTSGRDILQGLIAGEQDAEKLAERRGASCVARRPATYNKLSIGASRADQGGAMICPLRTGKRSVHPPHFRFGLQPLAKQFLLLLVLGRLPSFAQGTGPSSIPALVVQTGHTSTVRVVAFSPDGRWLASGSEDHTIKLWEVATRRMLQTLRHSSSVIAVAVGRMGDG